MSMKPRNLAPTCSKILLHCKNPWLPPFEPSCAGPSLTATAGTTNILLLLPEQGGSKQLLSQGREEKQQEGRPTRPLFQVPAKLLCCNLCQVSFRKIKFADFKVFAPYPPSPQPLALQQALAACNAGALSPKIHFPTAAGRALPHCPSAKLKRAAPRAAETATRGAWEVLKDLSGLCFDRPMQQKLGSLTTSRDLLAKAQPQAGTELRMPRSNGNPNASLSPLFTATVTLLDSDLASCTKWSDEWRTISLGLSYSL